MISNTFKNAWSYRAFILGSVKREFQVKYQNSMLGALWNVINPLAMIFVYTVIFSQLMRAKLPGVDSTFGYSIYLCTGILAWGLFSEVFSRNVNIFLENSNLLKKINFPSLCLPIISILSALLNFSIIFSLFIIFLVLSGTFPGMVIFLSVPILCILILFAVGLGITLGVLNVFFRDIGQLVGVGIQLWFWGTPIIYPLNILPEKIQIIVMLNPLTTIFNALQMIIVRGQVPNFYSLLPVFILSVILCVFGIKLYRKHSNEMVDEL
ncbi:ABC transporter permease [Vibrio sp. TH_r3]|uniref:ABC transporter permease n=1 Tax=Vibrio sp. TH_r3 TaxID=3082084 RepID=UPI00295562D3|nr:ABC transporter permease [Vibrio sp. TH_r3]MDV7104204.1 ABC transporter permease [Vibrio sp. TH_r3]